MKQLEDLFNGFSEVFSPNAPKHLARQCINKGKCHRCLGNIEWVYKDYGVIMHIIDNDFELNLCSNNGDNELFYYKGVAEDYIPMQEWDNLEIEIYLKENVL